MKLLLDTNVVIDVASRRQGYAASRDVLRFCELPGVEGFVSTTTVMDAAYILKKYLALGSVREAVRLLLHIVNVIAVQKVDVMHALEENWKDFEDAVQATCATRNKMDYIVTRNVGDFSASAVKAISPDEALKILQNHCAIKISASGQNGYTL